MGSPVKLRALRQHHLIPSVILRGWHGKPPGMGLGRRERGEEASPQQRRLLGWPGGSGARSPGGEGPGEMPTASPALRPPARSVQRGGRAEVAQLTKTSGFYFRERERRAGNAATSLFQSIRIITFALPLTYHQLLPQKCCRLYQAASSTLGVLVGCVQRREPLLACSREHDVRMKCFSGRAAHSFAGPRPEGCSSLPLSVPPGLFFPQSATIQ